MPSVGIPDGVGSVGVLGCLVVPGSVGCVGILEVMEAVLLYQVE